MKKSNYPAVSTVPPPPDEILVDGSEVREVGAILAKRNFKSKVKYLVQWSGFDDSENQWRTIEDLQGAEELVAEFEKNYVPPKTRKKKK